MRAKSLLMYEQNSGQRLDHLMKVFLGASKKDIDGDIATHVAKLQRIFPELKWCDMTLLALWAPLPHLQILLRPLPIHTTFIHYEICGSTFF